MKKEKLDVDKANALICSESSHDRYHNTLQTIEAKKVMQQCSHLLHLLGNEPDKGVNRIKACLQVLKRHSNLEHSYPEASPTTSRDDDLPDLVTFPNAGDNALPDLVIFPNAEENPIIPEIGEDPFVPEIVPEIGEDPIAPETGKDTNCAPKNPTPLDHGPKTFDPGGPNIISLLYLSLYIHIYACISSFISTQQYPRVHCTIHYFPRNRTTMLTRLRFGHRIEIWGGKYGGKTGTIIKVNRY
jgi:hypothetical protein